MAAKTGNEIVIGSRSHEVAFGTPRVYLCVVTVARCYAGDREKGVSVASRENGRKRRKYQRDRYKYGAIYDSLMYS